MYPKTILLLLLLSIVVESTISAKGKQDEIIVEDGKGQQSGCRTKCKFGAYCAQRGSTFRCECPPACQTFVRETPVCGSDGVTYEGFCIMQREACVKQREIRAVADGPCPGDREAMCESLSI